MTIDRAIEILNPEHRERYDSLETVKEACRMGMEALKAQKPVRPRIVRSDGYTTKRRWAYCGMCGAGLRIANGSRDAYCWRCGREVDWDGSDA